MSITVGYESELNSLIPNTVALLETSNLTLHPAVSRVVLHGSRGLAGGYRPDSDIVNQPLRYLSDQNPGSNSQIHISQCIAYRDEQKPIRRLGKEDSNDVRFRIASKTRLNP